MFFDGEEAYNHWTETDSLYGARHLADKWQKTTDRNLQTKNNLQTIVSLIGIISSCLLKFRGKKLKSHEEKKNLK